MRFVALSGAEAGGANGSFTIRAVRWLCLIEPRQGLPASAGSGAVGSQRVPGRLQWVCATDRLRPRRGRDRIRHGRAGTARSWPL